MPRRLASVATNLLLAMVLWLAGAALAMLTFWAWPRTPTGWLLVLAVGPAIYFLGEVVLGGVLVGLATLPPIERLGRWIELRTTVPGISGIRIAVLLGVVLAFIAVLVLLGFLAHAVFGEQLATMDAFLARHFH